MPRFLSATWVLIGASGLCAAQPTEGIAPFFGFGDQRIIVVDDDCGPSVCADFNGDGLPDIAVVNNRKSRIEVYTLRGRARTDADMERDYKANELTPNRWYERGLVSVRHRIGAVIAADIDGDGTLEIVYAASDPQEIVVLTRRDDGSYTMSSRRRVSGLDATATGFELANITGDDAPELIATVSGTINVFPITRDGLIGEPEQIGAGNDLRALFVEDFNGDGRTDVLAVAPNDGAPLRLWLQQPNPALPGEGLLGAELRFEMPPLIEVEPIRFPDRAAASIAVIERPTHRMVVYDLTTEPAQPVGDSAGAPERDVQAEVVPFRDGANKDRSIALLDVTGDGRLDLLATDAKGNGIAVHVQRDAVGLGTGTVWPSFKEPTQIAVGRWAQIDPAVFVMSREEKTVGVAGLDNGAINFPSPITLATAGAEPVAMQYVEINGAPTLAIVVKKKRAHSLELHRPLPDGGVSTTVIELEGVTRAPRSILAADADRDGQGDLLLFTPGEPMIMVRGAEGEALPSEVLKKDDMPQFGLVQAAGPDNTVIHDIDGDGQVELLIADSNFVRACVYDAIAGWSVLEQVNVPDRDASLAGLTVLEGEPARIVAADKEGDRLLVIGRDQYGRLAVVDRIRLLGFGVGTIHAGAFGGDDEPGILCLADDSFALVRLGGDRAVLEQIAVYRSDSDDRYEHEIAVGDINGDGYVDLVVLDAGEQMCEMFTFSKARKLYPATEFKVFETRLFRRGNDLEFQPSSAYVGDLTGDGKDDVMLTVHDRLIIYPQMTE